MNLRSRLGRLEGLYGPCATPQGRNCACRAPELSMPSVVDLVEEGFYKPPWAEPPCTACGAAGTVVPVSSRTGEPLLPITVIFLGSSSATGWRITGRPMPRPRSSACFGTKMAPRNGRDREVPTLSGNFPREIAGKVPAEGEGQGPPGGA